MNILLMTVLKATKSSPNFNENIIAGALRSQTQTLIFFKQIFANAIIYIVFTSKSGSPVELIHEKNPMPNNLALLSLLRNILTANLVSLYNVQTVYRYFCKTL
jgi:hypothetical protein